MRMPAATSSIHTHAERVLLLHACHWHAQVVEWSSSGLLLELGQTHPWFCTLPEVRGCSAMALPRCCHTNLCCCHHSLLAWHAASASLALQDEWPEDSDARKQIRTDFSSDESIGDRRQELVFIGQVRGAVCSLAGLVGAYLPRCTGAALACC